MNDTIQEGSGSGFGDNETAPKRQTENQAAFVIAAIIGLVVIGFFIYSIRKAIERRREKAERDKYKETLSKITGKPKKTVTFKDEIEESAEDVVKNEFVSDSEADDDEKDKPEGEKEGEVKNVLETKVDCNKNDVKIQIRIDEDDDDDDNDDSTSRTRSKLRTGTRIVQRRRRNSSSSTDSDSSSCTNNENESESCSDSSEDNEIEFQKILSDDGDEGGKGGKGGDEEVKYVELEIIREIIKNGGGGGAEVIIELPNT